MTKVLPQLLSFSFGDEPLNTDDVAAVQCIVQGDTPLKVTWYFNDTPITTIASGIHVVMTSPRVSQLTIEAVTAYHRGHYRCVAENRAGRSEYMAELRVNGTPKHNYHAEQNFTFNSNVCVIDFPSDYFVFCLF